MNTFACVEHNAQEARPSKFGAIPRSEETAKEKITMFTAYFVVTLVAIAANGFSGIAAMLHFKPILPGMARAGVPESWLTFPIGTLKTAGAIGLLLGLVDVPWIGAAAAIGLVGFFICALYTHLRAGDYSSQFGLAIGFLLLNVAALVLVLGEASVSAHDLR